MDHSFANYSLWTIHFHVHTVPKGTGKIRQTPKTTLEAYFIGRCSIVLGSISFVDYFNAIDSFTRCFQDASRKPQLAKSIGQRQLPRAEHRQQDVEYASWQIGAPNMRITITSDVAQFSKLIHRPLACLNPHGFLDRVTISNASGLPICDERFNLLFD